MRQTIVVSDFRPVDLRCEFLVEPLAVAETHPRFTWRYPPGPTNWKQTDFQIQVATSIDCLDDADLWDFADHSSRSINVVYGGKLLPPTEDVYWRVRGFGPGKKETHWSEPAHFARALAGNWQWYGAKWMSAPSAADWTKKQPSPVFRRVFELPENPIRKARLHFSARGLIIPYVNGVEASDIVFSPGWTDYNKRQPYDVEDVAHLLKPGANVLGAMLGDGWYCGNVCWFGRNQYGERPAALMRLAVEYEDREPILIVSGDEGWEYRKGPIRGNDLIQGESYSGSFETATVGEVESERGWLTPVTMTIGQVPLVPRTAEPVRRTETLRPIAIEKRESAHLVDFGQNLAGRVRLKAQANSHGVVRHGEILDAIGDLYTDNLRAAKATDDFQTGAEPRVVEPKFTFHGFRYAEIHGLDNLKPEDCEAVVLHNDLRRTGWFECSNPLFNKLFENTVWSMRGNFLEVPTDCPQRDERLGWTGDAQVFATTAAYLFDVAAFMKKWMRDVVDGASETGRFPNVAPQLQELGEGAPGWGDAGILVPMTMATFFGDERIVEENLPAMRRHVESILSINPDGLWRHGRSHDFGDWLAPFEETDKTFLGSAFLLQNLRMLSLNDRFEGHRSQELWWACLESFRNEYVQNGRLTVETQTAYALAIAFKLGLPSDFPQYAKRLNELIESNDGKLGTGFLGVNLLLPSLAEHGYFDRCYKLLLREDYPSWLYSVTKGATTIWERWDGWTEDRGFQDVGMNSFNHYAYGSVVQWFFEHIGGIQPVTPGFQQFRLAPSPGGNLEYAKVRFDSRYGTIRSEWQCIPSGFEWEIEIPPNTSADIVLPPIEAKSWTIDGARTKTRKEHIYNSNRAAITLGSGTYTLKSE